MEQGGGIVGWRYSTRHGVASIRRLDDGYWHAMVGDERLGAYNAPSAALDDMLGGHTFSPSSGVETDEMGLPDDLSEWEPIVFPRD